jgi:hypothetical protein
VSVRGRLVVGWVALVAAGLSATAWATIAIRFDVAALTSSADEVVLGRVTASASRWEGTRIITEADIQVAAPIIGQAQAREVIKVQSPGGRVGDLAQVVQGAPQLVPGQDALLFLERNQRSGALRVVGLSQGHFAVAAGPDARLWATQRAAGLTMASPLSKDDKGRTVAAFDEAQGGIAPLALDDLLAEVAQSARRLEIPLRPEVAGALGEDLKGRFDAPAALRRLELAPAAPARPSPQPGPPQNTTF